MNIFIYLCRKFKINLFSGWNPSIFVTLKPEQKLFLEYVLLYPVDMRNAMHVRD